MRIAIVDDCENERNELCKRLSQSSFSRSYDIEICGYGNRTDLTLFLWTYIWKRKTELMRHKS